MQAMRIFVVLLVSTLLSACGTGTPEANPADFVAQTSPEELRGALTPEEQSVFEFLSSEWPATDLMARTVQLDHLERGCLSRDCLCPIGGNDSPSCDAVYEGVQLDHLSPPSFVAADDTPDYLTDNDPVVSFVFNGEARAYPLAILTRHEIVNDTVAGIPVAITYCPLCNSALVFARLDGSGRELTFGVSGLLVNSGFVMWDRETESLWQQFTGRGIAGVHAGLQLDILPSALVSLQEFRASYAEGLVLEGLLPDFLYDQRQNPGYEELERPYFFSGDLDFRLNPAARVLGLNTDTGAVAYSWDGLTMRAVAHDTVGGTEIVIFYDPMTLSTFDAQVQMPDTRNVAGSAVAFTPFADGMRLEFELRDGTITDVQTGSAWSAAGAALSGELRGETLEIVPSANHFWFAWAAFNPSSELRALQQIIK